MNALYKQAAKLLLSLVLIACIFGAGWALYSLGITGIAELAFKIPAYKQKWRSRLHAIRGYCAGAPSLSSNKLNIGAFGCRDGLVNITIHAPMKFDGLSKKELFALRTRSVLEHPQLIRGSYKPSETVFGQIADGLSWTGIGPKHTRGVFDFSKRCAGLSEESLNFLNPFLLLGFKSQYNYRSETAYCRALDCSWMPRESQAIVTYDFTSFADANCLWENLACVRIFGSSDFVVR